MFGADTTTGLIAGEIRYDSQIAEWLASGDPDELAYRLTVEAVEEPDPSAEHKSLDSAIEQIPVGPFLGAILAQLDRTKLNGHDLVRTMKARERLVAHFQAGSLADVVEIAHSAAGDANSPADRIEEAAEFASDEIRAALTMTRRAADARLSLACDIRESLPRSWSLLDQGVIDLARAMVIVRGVAHLTEDEAREVVETVASRAPDLTTGQLAAWIRRLCIDNSPEKAAARYENALGARLLGIEQTEAGTGNVHILDIPIEDARAIGRRVNAHMISIRRAGDDRTHDQLRADIAVDLLLGADPSNGGRGLVEIRVDMTTLAGLDERAAEIPGLGPVVADVARKVADGQPRAEWRVVVTDDEGDIVDIITTSRRPSRALTRYVETTQPTCSFPGCRAPATQSDLDHLNPRQHGGPTSSANLGPKCRHDHILKDHGWAHRRDDGEDLWISPLGHTYVRARAP